MVCHVKAEVSKKSLNPMFRQYEDTGHGETEEYICQINSMERSIVRLYNIEAIEIERPTPQPKITTNIKGKVCFFVS